MRIKKHKNKNQYYLTEDEIWVRNFTMPNSQYADINNDINIDYKFILDNEVKNNMMKLSQIDGENINFNKIIIVSDGFNFIKDQEILSKINKDVAILAVNGALNKWKLIGSLCPEGLSKRMINYYIINNPYEEAMSFLPKNHSYFPPCISSSKTNNNFILKYKGNKFLYCPTPNKNYFYKSNYVSYMIDDYHNPICAALSLSYRFNAKSIALFCCDSSFSDYKPAAIKLENGLYSYEQQIIAQHVIDGMCYWLKKEDIKIFNCSNGIKYKNADYIDKNTLLEYFNN